MAWEGEAGLGHLIAVVVVLLGVGKVLCREDEFRCSQCGIDFVQTSID